MVNRARQSCRVFFCVLGVLNVCTASLFGKQPAVAAKLEENALRLRQGTWRGVDSLYCSIAGFGGRAASQRQHNRGPDDKEIIEMTVVRLKNPN